jgi:hypothetical protein
MIQTGRTELSDEEIKRVTRAFLIWTAGELVEPLDTLAAQPHVNAACIRDAADGMKSVVSAATLPFQLTVAAVQQRRFDRHLSAERIRSLKDVPHGEEPSEEQEKHAFRIASSKMGKFVGSVEGTNIFRDEVVTELDRSLKGEVISSAAGELLIQTLVSTWTIFEHFTSRFIVECVNSDPKRARVLLSVPELKTYFGKQIIDVETVDEHGFDLTRSMGTVIFNGRRLDNLSITRCLMEALFGCSEIRDALGDTLWKLNQRRHLFVHRRGLVDQEYLRRTGDNVLVGQRLIVSSMDIENYLLAVQRAILVIGKNA